MFDIIKYGLVDFYYSDRDTNLYDVESMITRKIISCSYTNLNPAVKCRINNLSNNSSLSNKEKVYEHFVYVNEMLSFSFFSSYNYINSLDRKEQTRYVDLGFYKDMLFVIAFDVFRKKHFPDLSCSKDINVVISEAISDFIETINYREHITDSPLLRVIKTIDPKGISTIVDNIEQAFLSMYNKAVDVYNKGKSKSSQKEYGDKFSILIDEYENVIKGANNFVFMNCINAIVKCGYPNVKVSNGNANLLNINRLTSFIGGHNGDFSCDIGKSVCVIFLGKENINILLKIREIIANYDCALIYNFKDIDISDLAKDTIKIYNHKSEDGNVQLINELESRVPAEICLVDYDALSSQDIRDKVFRWIRSNHKIPLFNSFDKLLTKEDIMGLGWYKPLANIFERDFEELSSYQCVLMHTCLSNKVIWDMCDKSLNDDEAKLLNYFTKIPNTTKCEYNVYTKNFVLEGITEDIRAGIEELLEHNVLEVSNEYHTLSFNNTIIIGKRKPWLDYKEIDFISSIETLSSYNSWVLESRVRFTPIEEIMSAYEAK